MEEECCYYGIIYTSKISSENGSGKSTHSSCATVCLPQVLNLNNSQTKQQARYMKSSSVISSPPEIRVD